MMYMPLRRVLWLGIILLVSGSAPCRAEGTAEVKIEKMQFVPQHLKIRAGTTVTWINAEKRNNHSVYFQQEYLPESDRLFPGESWQRMFDKPGMYPYICGPHPEMTGMVEVAP